MKKVLHPKNSFFSVLFVFFFNSICYSQSNPTIINNTGNFTVPLGVSSLIVELWGGGGGGANIASAAGGGGGGAYTRGILPVTPGSVISITIGNGSVVGGNGGNTVMSSILALGGSFGNNRIGGNGGATSQISGFVVPKTRNITN
jgi:hypothetical protein